MSSNANIKKNISTEYILCPNNYCSAIPEVKYTYEPLNQFVTYKCPIHNVENEDKATLFKFLSKSYHNIICPLCKLPIKDDEEFIYCKQCKSGFDYKCLSKHSHYFKQHNIISVKSDSYFNNCLNHNKTYIFRCINCNESLCGSCDLNLHNSSGHELKQIISISVSQNKRDKIISDFERQKSYFIKIKELYRNIIDSLEYDIFMKQKIIESYQKNKFNYQAINNFNLLEIDNNEKYEQILKKSLENLDILKNEDKNNSSKDSFIDQILSLLFYSLMINHNQDYNDSIIDILKNKINTINANQINHDINPQNINARIGNKIKYITRENNDDENSDEDITENNNENQNNNKDNNSSNNNNNSNNNNLNGGNHSNKKKRKISEARRKRKKDYSNKNNDDKKNSKDDLVLEDEKENQNIEIRNLDLDRSIYNMLVLQSGNIAASTKEGNIFIYDANNLSLSVGDNYLLQKITLNKNKQIKYIYQFPDETLFCGTYSKIIRIRLTNNDTQYDILDIIDLEKSELPTKIISLGDAYLLALTEVNKLCNLKLFVKKRLISESTNKGNNNNKDMNKINDKFEQSLKDYNLNEEKKLFCSIFEIKKKNKININNENVYEFISTSNYVYELGDNRIEFYQLRELGDGKLNFNRIKKIENISCSTKVNTICQLNDKYICIGLEDYDFKGQASGFAIVDINQKEVSQIIKDNKLICLNYMKEKHLLMAGMEIKNKKESSYMIKMYNIIENKDNPIEFKSVYQFKSKHKDNIVSLIELNYMNCAPLALNSNNKKFICASASMDSKLKVIETLLEK